MVVETGAFEEGGDASLLSGTDNDAARAGDPIWDPDEHPGSQRAVWSYSIKRFARDNKTLTAQESRAKAPITGDKPARTPRFVKTETDGLVLDEAALARALAGLARKNELLDNNEWAPTVRAIEDLFTAITGPPPRRYR